jgi:hypothetical protein
MSKRRSPENITCLNSVQQIHDRLERFALTNDLTRKLESRGLEIIRSVLDRYGASVGDQELTATYFFLPSQMGAVTRVLGKSLKEGEGGFIAEKNLVCVIFNDLDVATVNNFFHEQFHSLGKCLVREGDDQTTIVVGYLREEVTNDGELLYQEGDFLEEAVVNWLAAKATVEFFKTDGIELPEEEVVQQAGGDLYFFIQKAFLNIAVFAGLLPLFAQARFDPPVLPRLKAGIDNYYGLGTSETLFSLPIDEATVFDTVWPLVEKNQPR